MIRLEDDRFVVEVDDKNGGRVETFHDKASGTNWTWHPEGYVHEERVLDVGSPFDPYWTGGWEDVFPNDMADEVLGRRLVDHGELWSQRWAVDEAGATKARLSYECRTMPVGVTKSFNLEAGKLAIDYSFHNHANEALPVFFKFHVAVPIAPGDRFTLPDCEIEPVALGFSRLIGKEGRTRFPFGKTSGGGDVRVDTVPSRETRSQEFFYAMNLAEGRCGLRKTDGSELRLRFDRGSVPYVWVFQSYHMFRDHWVAILEPCTSIPYDLNEAYRRGTTPVIQPGRGFNVRIEVDVVRHA